MPALVFTKLIREVVDVKPTGGDRSLGQMVDDRIAVAMNEGEELNKIELFIEQVDWTQMLNERFGPVGEPAGPKPKLKFAKS